jgi:hypothetical protein
LALDFGLEDKADQCYFCPVNDVQYHDKIVPLFSKYITCWMIQSKACTFNSNANFLNVIFVMKNKTMSYYLTLFPCIFNLCSLFSMRGRVMGQNGARAKMANYGNSHNDLCSLKLFLGWKHKI